LSKITPASSFTEKHFMTGEDPGTFLMERFVTSISIIPQKSSMQLMTFLAFLPVINQRSVHFLFVTWIKADVIAAAVDVEDWYSITKWFFAYPALFLLHFQH